jgi:hypothetical protein
LGGMAPKLSLSCKQSAAAEAMKSDCTFTGHKQDRTGLLYFNARY